MIDERKLGLQQIAYTPAQAATVTGRSRSRIFLAIKNKELLARKDGRATLLEADELVRWIKALPVADYSDMTEIEAV